MAIMPYLAVTLAPEPGDDETRKKWCAFSMSLPAPRMVTDVTASAFNIFLVTILNGRSRAVYSPARVNMPDPRLVSRLRMDAQLSTSYVTESFLLADPGVDAAAMMADPSPPPKALKRPECMWTSSSHGMFLARTVRQNSEMCSSSVQLSLTR